ncbi:hypothetical protein BAE44_0021002 [Dichanthelium oligosanthes]|uniref:Plant heme peroxidase family profile domain-containing protein n=1 Tax=Dichanthelium oligosanthes TaxID=888268 RepID=A0A1E5UYL2_9POAL|nr:hypothetical protein BAE44_0021002 [Dichanthelium oligosanthes]
MLRLAYVVISLFGSCNVLHVWSSLLTFSCQTSSGDRSRRWHDAGTYDNAKIKTGGLDGANAGIKIAIDHLDPIKQKHPKITYADLYQIFIFLALGIGDKVLHTSDTSSTGWACLTKTLWRFLEAIRCELLKGDSEGLLKLPADKALVEDPEFRPYVEKYAKVHTIEFPSYIHASAALETEVVVLP